MESKVRSVNRISKENDRNNNKKSDVIIISEEILRSKKVTFVLKRFVDLISGLFGLLFFSPIFLIIAIAIKIEEPGSPIFFSQLRVGKNGKLFKMYKIRSMCIDAEEQLSEVLDRNQVQGAMFKMKEDPRITKVGRFIRKTSLDELPQLLNVLKGQMSLVGPRPPLEREVKEYSEKDLQRLLVKPGCTGLWQVSGRNDVGFDEMISLDLKYISEISILNDFTIIFKTVFVMIKPNGAY